MHRLREYAAGYDIHLDDKMLTAFEDYMRLLLEWNEKMNLTAITDPQEIIIKHFLDSLLMIKAVELPQGAKIIDIGTGAGFPGIPLKIVRADLRLTLLDSLNKRVRFLQYVSDSLGHDTICVHGRAEENGRDPIYREQYDVATARAVAGMASLCEYCLPFVKVGGCFAALKGGQVAEELAMAETAIGLLGGASATITHMDLPEGYRRSFVLVQKISQTSTGYPRRAVKIAKNPL